MNIPNGYKLVPVDLLKSLLDDPALVVRMSSDKIVAIKEALNSSAQPQPIYDEAKERELFEVYYRAEFEGDTGNELSDADIKSMRDGPWYGESRHYLNGQWAGWKACAQGRAKAGEVGNE